MAAGFIAASSQGLLNSAAPVTAVPFTVSLWFKSTAAGVSGTIFSVQDTAADDQGWSLFKTTGNTLDFGAYSGATYGSGAVTSGTVSDSKWHFIVYRAITTANRRGSLLLESGAIEHVQSTVSLTPTSVDAVSVGYAPWGPPTGNGDYFEGAVAEFTLWNVDIQDDGAQLQNTTLLRLARGGPFSLPHAKDNIIEYRSFRSRLTSDADRPVEIYAGTGKMRQTWTNTNSATLAAHVPLPGNYLAPINPPRFQMV